MSEELPEDTGVADTGNEDADGPWPDAGDCSDGEVRCDGICVDTDRDPSHCGACGGECIAPDGAQAQCVDGSCGWECVDELTACSGNCVDLESDPEHCGSCDNACEFAMGQGSCEQGQCVLDSCDAAYAMCPVDGQTWCVDLETDPEHCGECDRRCENEDFDLATYSVPGCEDGQCVAECLPNFSACSDECVPDEGSYDVCSDDCVDVHADPDHCGQCSSACESGQLCHEGTCVDQCPEGYTTCSGGCIDTGDHVLHCGGCNQACEQAPEQAVPVCDNAQCGFECYSGLDDCGGECVDLNSVDHCGECDNTCTEAPANAYPVCDGGQCHWECASGYYDCEGECVPEGQLCNGCDPFHPGPFGGGDGSEDDPYLLCTAEHWSEGEETYWETHFRLAVDLDFAGEGEQSPFGAPEVGFGGVFDGGGHEIRNMVVAGVDDAGAFQALEPPGQIVDLSFVDLEVEPQGRTGVVTGRNGGDIEGVEVAGSIPGDEITGGVVGVNAATGTIANSSIDVTTDVDAQVVGAVAGRNEGTIDDIEATWVWEHLGGWSPGGDPEFVGGIVGVNEVTGKITSSKVEVWMEGEAARKGAVAGYNHGEIEATVASGTLIDNSFSIGSSSLYVGGLVGRNSGTIAASQADVDIVAAADSVGGLVGFHDGEITDSAASGAVEGGGSGEGVGGLVGINAGSIHRASAQGDVVGEAGFGADVGGLVGRILEGAEVVDSYSTGDVEGPSPLGGIAGVNEGSIANGYSFGAVDVAVFGSGDPVIGDNEGSFGALFWNQDVHDTGEFGMGLFEAEFSEQLIFEQAGWDFDDVWEISADAGRPVHQ